MELRDIPGYEGFYAADRNGNIYRTERYGRRICRKIALREKKGYLVAHLCKDAIRVDVPAHRAVWRAFKGEIPKGIEINHKNGRRDDNRLDNLEAVTKSGNAIHKFRVNGYKKPICPLPGERNGSSKLTADKIRSIRKRFADGETQKVLGQQFGVTQVMIGKIVRRENWVHVKD